MAERQTKIENFLERARIISKRSTCFRARFGAVAVSQSGDQLSDGYNGAPRGIPDCLQKGYCLRDKMKIPHGHRYELCASVHAEQNTIINASRNGVGIKGSDLYIWGEDGNGQVIDAYPCFICKKMIVNEEMHRVIISQKGGGYKIINVEDWVYEWQRGDIIDDKEQYGEERNKAEKLEE